MSKELNQIQPLADEIEAWGDVPPLTGHTLFAEAATEKQRADLANMTLATLCDMVLGEDATDRSDAALVRAVGRLKRERDAAQARSGAKSIALEDLHAQLDAALTEANELRLRLERVVAGVTEWRKRAEQAEADARALAERVFETEILTDSEIEIVARYIQREQMERAGYLK